MHSIWRIFAVCYEKEIEIKSLDFHVQSSVYSEMGQAWFRRVRFHPNTEVTARFFWPSPSSRGAEISEFLFSGKSKGGLSKGGLGPKGANWAKKGPFGAISALPSWLWGAEELVPIGPEKAPIGPEKAQFAPKRPDFPGRISPRFSLKIWGLSPRL